MLKALLARERTLQAVIDILTTAEHRTDFRFWTLNAWWHQARYELQELLTLIQPRIFECGHCGHPIRDTYAGIDAGIVCPECYRDDGWVAIPEEYSHAVPTRSS